MPAADLPPRPPAPPVRDGRRAPVVFLPRDAMLQTMLESLSADLQAAGARVVRGQENLPGEVLDYPPSQYGELFGEADVAMFTSRSRCPRGLLAAAPRLRAVVNPTIGLDTVDVDAASELGIIVGHGATPENWTGMAEATVMLMLNLMYGLRRSEAVLAHNLPRPAMGETHARMMRGATVGLVGLGRIGRAVMQRLLPFEPRILVSSPRAAQTPLPPGVEAASFDRLLQESDIVGLFIAITPQNRRLVDARALSLMKRDAYLVNVSRGDAVDEPALVRALQERRIAGAALDTFAVEPLPLDSALRGLDNVILTPHLVGQTREGNASLGRAARANIGRVLRGELPLHCKNPQTEARWRVRVERLGMLTFDPAFEYGAMKRPPASD